MQTSKPITTISYNTHKFLTDKLNQCLESKIISFRLFVPHKAELDETKDHIHLYVELNKRVDTEEFRGLFKEKDLSNASDKPLGVQPFQVCNSFADMYLYFIHNPQYLASKHEYRQYNYDREKDVYTSDREYLDEKVRNMTIPKSMQTFALFYRYQRGEDLASLLLEYKYPINQWSAIKKALRDFELDTMEKPLFQYKRKVGSTTDKGEPAD